MTWYSAGDMTTFGVFVPSYVPLFRVLSDTPRLLVCSLPHWSLFNLLRPSDCPVDIAISMLALEISREKVEFMPSSLRYMYAVRQLLDFPFSLSSVSRTEFRVFSEKPNFNNSCILPSLYFIIYFIIEWTQVVYSIVAEFLWADHPVFPLISTVQLNDKCHDLEDLITSIALHPSALFLPG